MKTRMLQSLIISVSLLIPAGVLAADKPEKPSSPEIEVAFVLDTTGSMGGLIQAAKEKIWAIANTLATTKPAPHIKLALVAYRDRGDAYVTKRTDLTDDLDAVYKELMAFQADGGGDEPESVNQALDEAVTKLSWSKDDKTYRVLFLVGDAAPHMDYTNDVKFPVTCKVAATAGIFINSIQCGTQSDTEPVWRDIAMKAEGRYFRVEQSGGAILAATPFDVKLAGLAKDLDATRLFYGAPGVAAKQAERAKNAEAIYASASVAAQAQRCAFNGSSAGSWNLSGGVKELVDDCLNNRVKLAEIKETELPDELKKLSAGERKKFVNERVAKRKEIQQQVTELSAKRQSHLAEQMKKAMADGKSNLDLPIYDCVKAQAAKRGITYSAGPSL
ncbi:MAG: VWA domain-containing protein [Verrucomicrobiales bacterium]|nr:VWA domain-containing protein [Verrucomicrobiales bacterium]